LKSNGGRKRVNIHGAVNIETKDIVTDFPKSVNKKSTDRLCRKIEAKHPNAEKIHLFIDNASYYTARWLLEQLKLRKSKIVLHFLPTHSPNLNIIERLWKFLKKKILYNTYYEKFEDFLSACKNFFRCRTKYRAELRSLLTENFQLFE
jgi:transposase